MNMAVDDQMSTQFSPICLLARRDEIYNAVISQHQAISTPGNLLTPKIHLSSPLNIPRDALSSDSGADCSL